MKGKIFIPQSITAMGVNFLKEKGYEVIIGQGADPEQLKEHIGDADGLLARIAPYTADILEAAPRLKVIGRHGVGFENIDLKKADELGIWVTYTPQANMIAVAEHTIGLIIALAHRIVQMDGLTRKGQYEMRNKMPGVDLNGKTLGVAGLGRIGSVVAKKAKWGLEMNIIGYDPFVDRAIFSKDMEIEMVDRLEELFARSDFVCLNMPASEQTRSMVDYKLISQMKPSAFFINCARGEIVNEPDLYQALKNNIIAGAAIDVFDPEPPEPDNPLFTLDNIILTPHNAALTKETMDRMGLHAAMGIDEVLSGIKPTWPVNRPPVPRQPVA